MNEVEIKSKAARARVELTAHAEAKAQIRADLITAWLATDRLETDKREALWRAVKTLDMVDEALQSSISSGSVLDASLAVRDIVSRA